MFKFIIILLSALSSVSHADTSNDSMPGTFYILNTPLFYSGQAEAYRDDVYEGDHSVPTDVLFGRLGTSVYETTLLFKARMTGLSFCLSNGHDSIGSVFFVDGVLEGVHCVDSNFNRNEDLMASFSAGCSALEWKTHSCSQVASRFRSQNSSEENYQLPRYNNIIEQRVRRAAHENFDSLE